MMVPAKGEVSMRMMHLVGELPPTDKTCGWCEEQIEPGMFAPDQGTPMHYYCAVRGVVGSLDHLTRGDHKEGTCLPDDPRLTKREAALRAYRWWRARQEAVSGGHHLPMRRLAS